MNSIPKNKDNTSNFYSMNEFFKDLKKFPNNEELETKNIIESYRKNNAIEVEFPKNRNKRYFYKSEIRDKLINLSSKPNYTNEIMKSEITNISKENQELKFCLDILNKKYEKEMKDLKFKNIKKIKEIQSTKEILKKNITLIELLGSKVVNYEEILKQNEIRKNKSKSNEKIEDKVVIALKEKEELEKEIHERDEIIKSYKEQIDSKKDMFEEVDKMKKDMEDCLKTMEELYKEIVKKDEQIDELKKNMELMNTKHGKEIEELSKNKKINLENASNDEILAEITRSKDTQTKMAKELVEIQKNYINAKNTNIKLENLTKEASEMIKKTIDSRNSIKKGYDKAIEELVEKYEKQIRFMKVVIVEQNEKFEKQLEAIKNSKNKEDNNNNEDIEDKDEKNKYLEKLKKDNIMLMEQNLELKNMNDLLLIRMNEIPDLHNKFTELFEKVKLLKEENDLLKKSLKNKKYLQMMSQEYEEEEKEDEENLIKEKKSLKNRNENNDNDNDNDNNEDNKKLNLEELILLDSLLKEMENNNGKEGQNKKEFDINKLLMIENILKKIENKIGEDDKETEYKKEKEENEEEENKNEKDQILLETKLKSFRETELDEKNKIEKNIININNNSKIQNNKLNKEELNNSNNNKPTKIYNKKFFKSSPKIIKTTYNNKSNNKKYLKKINNDNGEEIENDEKEDDNNEEEDEDENAQNQINVNFNLFKPTKEGILAFNLSQKIYSTTIPENFDEFSILFDPNTSVQYNTLEGLFVIPSNKSNKLFYYSSKNNIINELFFLKENHAGGCLLLDNSSKYLIALGGYESKAVEKFTFETEKLEQLPEMSTCRCKISCNQIGNKLYCFFGISKEKPNKSIVECLDLENVKEGWIEVNFKNNTNYNVISGMSSINLNDKELLIIGGLLNDKIPNETLLYFNIEEKILNKIEKNLPDSEDKVYIFTQNTMFNLFVNGEIISFANIDNNNNVHILDNDLCYDLYLTPKIN